MHIDLVNQALAKYAERLTTGPQLRKQIEDIINERQVVLARATSLSSSRDSSDAPNGLVSRLVREPPAPAYRQVINPLTIEESPVFMPRLHF